MSARPADPSLRLAALLSLLCLAALGCDELLGGAATDGGGNTGGGGDPPPVSAEDLAGVQAFGSVIRASDGRVYARMDVVTLTGEARFLSGIANPTLTVGSTTIPLVTGAGVGVFETDSTRARALSYAPGATYLFGFSVVDDTGFEHVFRALATAPTREPQVEIAPDPFRMSGEPIEVGLVGVANGGILRVRGPNGVTWDTSRISSLAELPRVRPAMEATTGPYELIPGTAFPSPGSYTIEFTNLSLSSPTPQPSTQPLGNLSWFAAGAASALVVQTE